MKEDGKEEQKEEEVDKRSMANFEYLLQASQSLFLCHNHIGGGRGEAGKEVGGR